MNFKYKLNAEVVFIHPRKLVFFSGIIIARLEAEKNYREMPCGVSYIIELKNKSEIRYIEERLVFTSLDNAKENIFEALQQ